MKWVSNHLPGSLALLMPGETQLEANRRQEGWLAQTIQGPPREATEGPFAAELAAKGYVGLYLPEDGE